MLNIAVCTLIYRPGESFSLVESWNSVKINLVAKLRGKRDRLGKPQ